MNMFHIIARNYTKAASCVAVGPKKGIQFKSFLASVVIKSARHLRPITASAPHPWGRQFQAFSVASVIGFALNH